MQDGISGLTQDCIIFFYYYYSLINTNINSITLIWTMSVTVTVICFVCKSSHLYWLSTKRGVISKEVQSSATSGHVVWHACAWASRLSAISRRGPQLWSAGVTLPNAPLKVRGARANRQALRRELGRCSTLRCEHRRAELLNLASSFICCSCTRWEDGTNERSRERDAMRQPTSALGSPLRQGKPPRPRPAHAHLFPA